MDTLLQSAERALREREGKRITDIVLGKGDRTTQVSHYLVIERMDPERSYAPDVREIEAYRDLERLIANARDFETGDRDGKCLGAFKATYHNGKLASVEMVDLAADVMKVHPDRARRNMLVEGDQ
jgi:hypothetical protein